MNVGYLAMNMDKEPFQNLNVRRAINHAINKQALIDNLYQGLAIPAVNPIPPTVWSYRQETPGYEYDPGKSPNTPIRRGISKRIQNHPLGHARTSSLYATTPENRPGDPGRFTNSWH